MGRFGLFGNLSAIIRFPCIWKGKEEPIWRFLFIFRGNMEFPVILFEILFTFVNATIKELLWRGLILTRVMDNTREKTSFIDYRFDLCYIAYFDGISFLGLFDICSWGILYGRLCIISKGLLASWFMHIIVNLIFVFSSLIF